MASRRLVLTAVAALTLAAATAGAGWPVPQDAGPSGVVTADGGSRYVTLPAARGTVLARVASRGGAVIDWRFLHERLTVPGIALDGTGAGLSHDGRTLVLVRPRAAYPSRRSTIAFLDARRLQTRRTVTLRGDFSFDALSPDGSVAYLVQYTAGQDASKYLVRALDPATGRLEREPIVDPREDPDEMAGYPMTRVAGADGRWQYTLYDGMSGHPFIHALDTVARRAVCIDLPAPPDGIGADQLRLALTPGGGALTVASLAGPLAAVDTRTFQVDTAVRWPAQRAGSGVSSAASPAVHGGPR
jgi:hypothetical protein